MLQVEDLRYAYGPTEVVRGVDFSVERGEAVGFLGPNGAGKTTTLSCVSGLLRRWSGTMTWAGRPFRPAELPGDRRRLGLVPQELALYENLTARENLDFFARLNGLDRRLRRDAVPAALDMAGLQSRADDRVETFSGGMKRRLNLAVGQVHGPELLLLDEPTAGVDAQSRAHLFESLLRLRDAGMTLVYTTHILEEVERLCRRVVIVDRGHVVADGTPEELAGDTPGRTLEDVFLSLTGRSTRDDGGSNSDENSNSPAETRP